jgi:hypothetical protein
LHLIVRDDGVGLHALDLPEAKSIGVGLMGMRERVHELGGRISMKSGVKGTVVTVSLPRLKRTTLAPPIDGRFPHVHRARGSAKAHIAACKDQGLG